MTALASRAPETARNRGAWHVAAPFFAGLLAAAGAAQAQGTTNVPAKAGEASTMTNGVPNAKTTNSPVSEAPIPSRAGTNTQAQVGSTASSTTP
ncbi:MAG TPA: hypothetical protein VGP57_15530, partial [Actinoplanes sp.]|nr:hypothetical protein [Actinoplanes sp.]